MIWRYCWIRNVSFAASDMMPPPVPTIEISDVPGAALLATVRFTDVETDPDDTVDEPNVRLTPAGTPDAASVTAPAKLPSRVMDSPRPPTPPGASVRLDGVRLSEIVPEGIGWVTPPVRVSLVHAASSVADRRPAAMPACSRLAPIGTS